MRKQTKLVAVLSAAALLAIGASMTSFAATPHWAEEDGVWVYLDSDGERVTNEWKKSNGAWYYLDDDGEMAIDTWVDSDYYTGTDGKMITNNWAKLTDEDADDADPDEGTEHWYYFDSKGKKQTDEKKTINGKVYFFDTDGKMRDGWYQDDNNIYYLGDEDDGSRKSGWLWLEVENDDDVDVEPDDCNICDDEGWYWFDANGKMWNGGNSKKINGKQYYFNEHGQMIYNWVQLATASDAHNLPDTDKGDSIENMADKNIAKMRYAFGVDKGYRVDGWLKVNGSDAVETIDDEDWYFFKKGEAKHATSADSFTLTDNNKSAGDKDKTFTRTVKKIKVEGKEFAFDANGAMCDGLQAIKNDNATDGYDTYYFDAQAGMKTGKVSNVEEDDGDTYTYYFTTSGSNKGRGYTGEKDGYLYNKGRRQEADDDYKVYFNTNGMYVVNKSGKIQKGSGDHGKKFDIEKIENEEFDVPANVSADIEDVYIKTDKNGKITGLFFKENSKWVEVDETDRAEVLGAVSVETPDWEK